MNNYNFTQSLDGLNNIEADSINTSNLNVGSLVADNAEITTLSDSNLVNCTTTTIASGDNDLVNKKYVVDNFVDRTNNLTQSINGVKTFSNNCNFTSTLFLRTNLRINDYGVRIGNTINLSFPLEQTILLAPSSGTSMILNLPLATSNEIGMIFTFYKRGIVPFDATINITSPNVLYLSPSGSSSITNTTLLSQDKIITRLAVGNVGSNIYWIEITDYSIFDRDQNNLIYPRLAIANLFTNTNTFSNTTTTTILYTKDFRWNDAGGSGTIQQTYLTNTTFLFVPLFNSNTYGFQCRDAGAVSTTPLTINSASTTISNALSITGQSTFTGEATFNNWVNLKFRMRIYELSNASYTQLYMLGGNEFIIAPQNNGDFISFYCKDATLGQIQTFKSSALGNTSLVKLTCSSSLVSNNITAPIVLGGTNNIFTNLDNSTGGGIINIGAMKNNINVKCNLNINESGYGTGQNTLIWMEGNSSRFENQNSTNGNYIFTIVESGTFNPFVINKTSVDIAGDANIRGNLILYDSTPSTLTMSVGVLGNDMTFDPENTTNTTYKFKVNDATGTLTTPLTISTASTTVANAFISNGQATFNSNLISTTAIIVQNTLAFKNGTNQLNASLTASGELMFQSFFVSNLYKFRCINSTNTLEKFLTITFDKTTIQTPLEVVDSATFNGGAVFNTVIPTTSLNANTNNQIVNWQTLNAQGFITSASILGNNNIFTGFNTFDVYQTFKGSVVLKNTTNEGTITMLPSTVLSINTNVPSGKIEFSSDDAGGANSSRAFINENEFNFEVPITFNMDYTYYNPTNFTSTRLGYSISNTGSSNTLTNNNVNNSGRINIDAGSWNISYTATLTVISATLTSLNSLELYVGDSALNDLNIIGINVLNYYNISSVPIGQKIKISGSGNYISYTNVSTELNLLILPIFTAGLAGLSFQGKISATRNA